MTVWLLAALMQLSTALVVESIQPNADGVAIVLRNNSAKTITAFGFKHSESQTQFRDYLEPIKPNTTYSFQMYVPVEIKISAVVFDDGSTEGPDATEILAQRDGARHAELKTARQVRTFLQFNSVIDDSALSVLDRELEESATVPPLWNSNGEKNAWQTGYKNSRETVRKIINEVPQEHRLEQLKQIGGAR